MDNFDDMTPITKKTRNDFYTAVDTQKTKTRLDNDKINTLLYDTYPSTPNPLNESQELLRQYTTEMEDLKNAFEGEQSSITEQKNKVKQILKQVRALKEKVPESHLPKSNESIFGGYLLKWLEMLYPNGENLDYTTKNSSNTEKATYVSMGIKRWVERCDKLKGQLFDSEEKSKMKTNIIQELSTSASLLQSQLEMEKKNEEKQNKIFQLEDQNLELKRSFLENSDRYEQVLTENTLNRKKIRDLKSKLKEVTDELDQANIKNKEVNIKLEESQETIQSLRDQLKKAKEKVVSLENSLEQTRNRVVVMEQENQNVGSKMEQLNTHFLELIQNKDKQITEVENKSDSLTNKLKTLKEKFNTLQTELQNEKQNNVELQRKLQHSLNNENESSNVQLKLQKKITSLENQIDNKEQIIENLQSSLEKEKKKNESFNESLRKKEINLIQLTEETVKMSERLLGRSKQILDYSGHDNSSPKYKKSYNYGESEDD